LLSWIRAGGLADNLIDIAAWFLMLFFNVLEILITAYKNPVSKSKRGVVIQA
jgi:hypothetical protein